MLSTNVYSILLAVLTNHDCLQNVKKDFDTLMAQGVVEVFVTHGECYEQPILDHGRKLAKDEDLKFRFIKLNLECVGLLPMSSDIHVCDRFAKITDDFISQADLTDPAIHGEFGSFVGGEIGMWEVVRSYESNPKGILGLRYEQTNERVKVLAVIPGSNACKAGFRSGDQLIPNWKEGLSFTEFLRENNRPDRHEFNVLRQNQTIPVNCSLIKPTPSGYDTKYITKRALAIAGSIRDRIPEKEEPLHIPLILAIAEILGDKEASHAVLNSLNTDEIQVLQDDERFRALANDYQRLKGLPSQDGNPEQVLGSTQGLLEQLTLYASWNNTEGCRRYISLYTANLEALDNRTEHLPFHAQLLYKCSFLDQNDSSVVLHHFDAVENAAEKLMSGNASEVGEFFDLSQNRFAGMLGFTGINFISEWGEGHHELNHPNAEKLDKLRIKLLREAVKSWKSGSFGSVFLGETSELELLWDRLKRLLEKANLQGNQKNKELLTEAATELSLVSPASLVFSKVTAPWNDVLIDITSALEKGDRDCATDIQALNSEFISESEVSKVEANLAHQIQNQLLSPPIEIIAVYRLVLFFDINNMPLRANRILEAFSERVRNQDPKEIAANIDLAVASELDQIDEIDSPLGSKSAQSTWIALKSGMQEWRRTTIGRRNSSVKKTSTLSSLSQGLESNSIEVFGKITELSAWLNTDAKLRRFEEILQLESSTEQDCIALLEAFNSFIERTERADLVKPLGDQLESETKLYVRDRCIRACLVTTRHLLKEQASSSAQKGLAYTSKRVFDLQVELVEKCKALVQNFDWMTHDEMQWSFESLDLEIWRSKIYTTNTSSHAAANDWDEYLKIGRSLLDQFAFWRQEDQSALKFSTNESIVASLLWSHFNEGNMQELLAWLKTYEVISERAKFVEDLIRLNEFDRTEEINLLRARATANLPGTGLWYWSNDFWADATLHSIANCKSIGEDLLQAERFFLRYQSNRLDPVAHKEYVAALASNDTDRINSIRTNLFQKIDFAENGSIESSLLTRILKPTVADYQKLCGNSRLHVEYFVTTPIPDFDLRITSDGTDLAQSHVYAIWITKDEPPVVTKVGSAKELVEKVKSFVDRIKNDGQFYTYAEPSKSILISDEQGIQKLAEDLSSQLLDASPYDLTNFKIISIAPDGFLYQLPFAALRLADEAGEMKYLAESHTIEMRRTVFDLQESVTSFVADDFNRTTVLTCQSSQNFLQTPPPPKLPGRFRTSPEASGLRDIPEVSQLHDRSNWGVKIPAINEHQINVLSGYQASENYLVLNSQCRYLFIGAHGMYSTSLKTATNPFGSSALLLSPDSFDLPEELRASSGSVVNSDGDLTAYEISTLPLESTRLVGLACCNTAIGTNEDDIGPAGVRLAFQLAGAHNVLASLWELPTTETLDLFTYITRELPTEVSPADLCVRAQRSMINKLRSQRESAHPYFWAGMQCFTIFAEDIDRSD